MERRWAFCPLAAKIPIEDEKRLSLCRPAAYQKTRRTPASEECARVRLCTGPEFACVEVTGIREEVDYSIYCPAGGRLNPGTALSRREQQLCIHKWISSEGLSAFFSSNGKKKKKKTLIFLKEKSKNNSSISIRESELFIHLWVDTQWKSNLSFCAFYVQYHCCCQVLWPKKIK